MVDEKKTFVVVGIPRSGTSMLGGVLRLLGIHMGDHINGAYQDKHEDHEFYVSKDAKTRTALIKKRNNAHDIWGFKDPKVSMYINELLQLRNPHFIMIFRDIYACVKSNIERNPNADFGSSLTRARSWYERIVTFYLRNQDKHKFHFVSYEKFLLNKEKEVDELARFCGINWGERYWGCSSCGKEIEEDSERCSLCGFGTNSPVYYKHKKTIMKFVSPGYKGLNDERGDWKDNFHYGYFDGETKSIDMLKTTIRPQAAWDNLEADVDNNLKSLGIDDSKGTILEIGCGIGRLLKELKYRYNKIVYGIDASARMILFTKRYAPVAKTYQCQGNGYFRMNDVDIFDRKFDCIFSFVTFQHIKSINAVKRYILESYKYLNDGGYLRFQIINKHFECDKNELIHYHSEGVLMDCMKKQGFKDITINPVGENWNVIVGQK